jgi:hypothetical protein
VQRWRTRGSEVAVVKHALDHWTLGRSSRKAGAGAALRRGERLRRKNLVVVLSCCSAVSCLEAAASLGQRCLPRRRDVASPWVPERDPASSPRATSSSCGIRSNELIKKTMSCHAKVKVCIIGGQVERHGRRRLRARSVIRGQVTGGRGCAGPAQRLRRSPSAPICRSSVIRVDAYVIDFLFCLK